MNPGFGSKHSRKLLIGSISKKALSKELLGVGLLSILTSNLASAAEWRFTPSVDLTETYTDNVILSSDSGAESDWISQINPGLSLTGKGRELELTFGYRMQNILYAGDSGRNNTNHQLNTALKATLAPHWLFLDASSTLSQQVLSSDENVSVGNLGVVSGREDVLTSSISPYIATRLSNRVLADFRFTHDRVSYSGNTAADSSSEQVSLSLKSAKAFGSWTWALRSTEQDIKYSGQSLMPSREDVKIQDSVLDLGYQLSAKIRLTGQAGYEDHEYQLSADSKTPQGRYWSVGTVWSPSSQTMLTLSGGHRYFGHTWKLDWSHQARRNNWQLAYNENISSRRQLQLELRDSLVADPNTLDQILLTENVLVPTDEIFIDRRASFHWVMSHRKSTTTFQLNRSRKEFQESNATETTVGIDLAWDWRVSRNSEISANIGSQKTERDTGNDRYKLTSLSYEKQLGKHVSSSYDFRNVRRDTSGLSNSYSENQLSATLQMSW